MKNMYLRTTTAIAASALLAFTSIAQQNSILNLTVEQYEDLKAAGALPAQFHVDFNAALPIAKVKPAGKVRPIGLKGGGGGVNGDCDCWLDPDSSYSQAMQPNDDGSSGIINLPFSFNMYGDLYNTCYINNNGNVSFVNPYGTYTASGFPSADYIMAAPFWADVDTRGDDGLGLNGGRVWYKLTPTALYVNWVDVGYFPSRTDKKNWFQLIITDGNDPVIGVGKNVSFCYRDMAWTTGSASCIGTNPCTYNGQQYSCNDTQGLGWGFCGGPSTVGANRGNGVDYIQFTRNDHPGTDYDGPQGNPDGVDWLDGKNFVYTTAVATQNIPPIASSDFLCDTVRVCTGEYVDILMNFLGPEAGQLVTASSSCPTIPGYTEAQNTSPSGNVLIQSLFIPQIADVGFHVVTYTATDDGIPALTTTITIVLEVFFTPAVPPVISGDSIACEGEGVVLVAGPGFDEYQWNNGYMGTTILVGPGTYQVIATAGICRLASNIITVDQAENPEPVITGTLFNCGGQPSVLSTTEPYASYNWSNGSTDPTTSVGTGSYTVTVTSAEGCEGTSAAVNVLSANTPSAFFITDSPNPVYIGSTVIYTDQSNGNGGTIVSWQWVVDTFQTSNGQVVSQEFTEPGTYAIQLTVTTADGCTETYIYYQHVIPTEIIVPNVFSPNGDNSNDQLEFENAQYFDNNKLRIYNRWGNLIYENDNYRNTWAPAKSDVPEGTYFFLFNMKDGRDYQGHVTLVR